MNDEKIETIVPSCFNVLRQKSGRKMDLAFIEAGFVGVQAEIDLFSITFGRDSYESLLKFHSSEDCRREVVKRIEFIRDTFSEYEGTDKIESLASQLVAERGIPGESKYSILRRYAPGILDEMFSPHMPEYRQKLQEQAQLVCKTFPPPSENLRPQSTSSSRKEIFNRVSSEVFSDLGFSLAKKKRGLNSYTKRLSKRFTLEFKIDHGSFEIDYSSNRDFPSRYWGAIALDRHLNVICHDDGVDSELMGLGMADGSVAEHRSVHYDGSCSLEVAIRAYGLWYEIAVKPIENLLLEAD